MRHPTLLDRRTVRGPVADDGNTDAAAWLAGAEGGQEWRWDDDLEREPPHSLPEGMRLREYEILGQVGEGGSGIVYLAWDHSSGQHVAIKEYLPRTLAARDSVSPAVLPRSQAVEKDFRRGLQSFVDEGELLTRFDHPALVEVLRHWEDNGTAYMAMPYYDGPTLTRALARLGRPPDEAEVLAWLTPLLDALAVLHAGGCLHRDVAPDNILLTDSGPVLLDFGSARQAVAAAADPAAVVFKPGYAPIEQYRESKEAPQGPWTDLYAVAALVYAAIAGEPPQPADERAREDRFEPLTQRAYGRWRAAFLTAVDAALALSPKDRPQSVDQFRALLALDGEIEEETEVAPPSVLHTPPLSQTPSVSETSPKSEMPTVSELPPASEMPAAPEMPPVPELPPVPEVPPVPPPQMVDQQPLLNPMLDREPRLLGPLAALPPPRAPSSARSLRRRAGRRHIHKGVYLGIALVLLAGLAGYQRMSDRSTVQSAAQAPAALPAEPVVQARAAASALASAAASAATAAAKALAPLPVAEQAPASGPASASAPVTASPPRTVLAPAPSAPAAEPARPAQLPLQALALAPATQAAPDLAPIPTPLPPPSPAAAVPDQGMVTTVRPGTPLAAPQAATALPSGRAAASTAAGQRPAADSARIARREWRRRDADELPARVPIAQAWREPGQSAQSAQSAQAQTRGWCTDLLQRASLQPLTAGEVALLRSECK